MRLHILRVLVMIAFIAASCKQPERKEFRKVTLFQYHVWPSDLNRRDLKYSSILYVDSAVTAKGTEYTLRTAPHSDSSIAFSYSIAHDGLLYRSTYCDVLDSVNLKYNGQRITLYRSNFDKPNLADEESHLFWNHDYGLVGIYNWSTGPLLLFDDDRAPNFAKEVLYEFVVELEKKRTK